MWLEGRIARSERIPNPLDRLATAIIRIDGDHIETHRAAGELRSLCQEQGRRTNQFPLLVNIDGRPGTGDSPAASKTNFGKDQAIVVQHDKIDLTESAAKVAGDGCKSLIGQEPPGLLLGPGAYSSRGSSDHNSSAASSGNNSSGAPLIS